MTDCKLEQFSDSLCVIPSDIPSFESFLALVCAAIGLIGYPDRKNLGQ